MESDQLCSVPSRPRQSVGQVADDKAWFNETAGRAIADQANNL